MKIEVEKGILFWHWRILARNGEILASSETYSSKAKAIQTATKLASALGIAVNISD